MVKWMNFESANTTPSAKVYSPISLKTEFWVFDITHQKFSVQMKDTTLLQLRHNCKFNSLLFGTNICYFTVKLPSKALAMV
jgi:hypothetical protein